MRGEFRRQEPDHAIRDLGRRFVGQRGRQRPGQPRLLERGRTQRVRCRRCQGHFRRGQLWTARCPAGRWPQGAALPVSRSAGTVPVRLVKAHAIAATRLSARAADRPSSWENARHA